MRAPNRDTAEAFWDAETISACAKWADHVRPEDFLMELRAYLRVAGRTWAMPSARVALELLLSQAITKKPSVVLVCSFNCPVVAQAVLNAGLQVETYDLASPNGVFAWNDIASSLSERHSAIVVPHLFGVPTNFRALQEPCKRLSILIVEDCSHTIGGTINGVVAGTLGDAAIFSFNYDKPMSLGGGGALLVNNEEVLRKVHLENLVESFADEWKSLKRFVTFVRFRRRGISSRLWRRGTALVGKLGVGRLPLVKGLGPLRSALGIWQLKRYPEILKQRNRNSEYITKRLGDRTWHVDAGSEPAWLKQKFIADDRAQAERISRHLQRGGLRVGRFNWPTTIDQYVGLPPRANATHLARCGLDIPVHQNMTTSELDMIWREICGVCQ